MRLSVFGRMGVWMFLLGLIAAPFVAAWTWTSLTIFIQSGNRPEFFPWFAALASAAATLVTAGGLVMLLTEREFEHEVTVLPDE